MSLGRLTVLFLFFYIFIFRKMRVLYLFGSYAGQPTLIEFDGRSLLSILAEFKKKSAKKHLTIFLWLV